MQQTDLLIQSTTSQQSTPRHDTKIQKYTSSSVVHRRLDFHRPPQKRLNEWHSSASFLAKVEPTTGGTPTVSPHFCGNVSPTLWKSVPHIVGSHSPPSLSDSSVSFSFPEWPPMLPPLPGLWHTAAPLWDKKRVFVPTPPTTCAPGIWRTFGFFRRLKSKEVPLWAKRVRGGASWNPTSVRSLHRHKKESGKDWEGKKPKSSMAPFSNGALLEFFRFRSRMPLKILGGTYYHTRSSRSLSHGNWFEESKSLKRWVCLAIVT